MDGVAASEPITHLIVGGGLAGGLAALALAHAGRGRGVAIVEAGAALGGNHTWSFHESDLNDAERALVMPLVTHRWPRQVVRFRGRERTLQTGYLSVSSERFQRVVGQQLARAGARVWTGARVVELGARRVRLQSVQQLEAAVVLDARGPAPTVAARAFQKFVGLELALSADGPWELPVVMDATVDQGDGFHFVYVLPFSRRRVLIEDTVYATDAALDGAAFERRALAYAAAHGAQVAKVLRRESGVLPLHAPADPAGDDGEGDDDDKPLAIGYRGGLFHAVTGYSLPLAARAACAIAACDDRRTTAQALARLGRALASQRRFERLLNRLLFGAMPAAARWTALDRFYRMPEATIRRFYASRSTVIDRARLLLGRPPAGLVWRRLLTGARGIA